ncbi:PmrA [Streptomyces sp. NPDC091215]|uniref:PmrA n=1 Tax=Streptomyces sp. NPDC091215 TaxID=3155192 RepID=UPI00342A3596
MPTASTASIFRRSTAEGGTSTTMLLARSSHASVRSLERYARPGVDAVARHVAERDPAARRKC